MGEVTCIILAAGLSRRMGERNKLLLPIDGIPMIRLVVATYRAATSGTILVVTGHESDQVEASLFGCDVQTVFNPDFTDGQQTSVACGLRSAPEGAPVLIGLGDQPLLSSADLDALLLAHANADPARISIPMRDGKRGNPILIPNELRGRLLADPRSPGCKKYTRANPEHVQFLRLHNPGFYADVDTPEAYDAFSAKPYEETQ